VTGLDWAVLAAVYLALVAGVQISKRYMRSVADFLAAGRTAGRYLLSVSQGMAALGAITIVANLEMNFEAGFAMSWWGLSMGLVVMILAVSGWVIYRFRATRSLTLAEFLQRRYSRNFRVFAGVIAFAAGIVNFGIFPSVGARFFIYFTGLPPEFEFLGIAWETYPLMMLGLLATSLYFVFAGGQVAVIVTDFLQGLFANVVFIVVPVYMLFVVDWSRVAEVLTNQPEGKSLINPFDTSYIDDFNVGYFLIGMFGVIYSALSWQGTQAYNTSAKSAHEAKMGGVLAMWRGMPQGLLMLLLPILAATVMQHPDWSETARTVTETAGGVGSEAIGKQLKTPLVLRELLPPGIMGMFCAMMLAAFISTHDTYLHSWGSIFIQDVVMPFRKRSFSPKNHLRLLRLSILVVALFIFAFSYFYVPTEAILLYFAITGAIFAGGSGAVIIGGLYWKRGTTGAAWAALITGSTTAVGGLIIRDYWQRVYDADFPVNGQQFWGLAMGGSALVYILVSLLVRPRVFNLDKLLRRGRHAIEGEKIVVEERPRLGWRIFGMGKEFTRRDRFLYLATYVWTFLQIAVFAIGTIYSLTHEVGDGPWLTYWQIYIWVSVVLSVFVILWFTVGGFRDMGKMMRALATMKRDPSDDGMVRHEKE
jgi:SSS family solute:Na+ symporter